MGRCLLHARLDAEQIHLRRTRKKLPHAVSSVNLAGNMHRAAQRMSALGHARKCFIATT